ncbi:MAG: PQQ-binding-like beta-propeller repeat protein, partial [Acidobacteriales bacterium]|nr:PQQ-binding-like beta-propeller repeat protein [Terriglobales bacterium]
VLLAGGGWLLSLGGSAYYLLAGLGFLITAILLFQKNAHALSVYAVIIVASLAWALWEVGLDWWQLGPRGGVIILIGIWLLTPWIRVPLGFASPTGYRYGVRATPLAIAVVLSIVVAVVSMFFDPYDQAGELPQQQAAADPAFGGNVPAGEWHQYGRTPYGQRYSPLDQISVKNVKDLQEVWRYQTGDVKRPDDVGETTYQVTPLKVGNSLYLCTPHNWAIALDAATGKEKWKYDANAGMNPDRQHQTCRGVSYYKDEAATPGSACAERVYLPTSDARLIALDAANGQVCTFFADKGVLHLETGMKYNPAGYYYSTSPPAIAAGKIIIGGALVYASLLERMALKGFRYSTLGLRDGILAQMLADVDLRTSVHQKIENERWTGVLEVCRRYGVQLKNVEPVREHVVQLFNALARVHELPEEYKLWLEAAAMMHDVGKFMNHQGHYRHTQYIVANSEIFGFSPEQRTIVSAIARYMGKTRPDPSDRLMRTIPAEEHEHVRRAVVLLRLAVALNQDRATAAVRMRVHVYPKRVLLDLISGRTGAELEAWSLRKEADYFKEVFRRELFVEVA